MSATLDTTKYLPMSPLTMPSGVHEGLTNFPATASERRIVTILFCDVAGSTAMAELLDPEEWADLMSEAFAHLIRPIERYEGTVIRLMGDAVLALFGAPQAHANDPQRAILAGLEIIQGIESLRERIQRQRGLDFNVRIGINTGLVVVGAFGSAELVEYTAMGDAINVAARIQQLADPGTIHVGEETHRLTERYFDFEPLGESDVRGKRQPERTFRVLAPRPTPAVARGAAARQMPFTGRAAEMAALRQAIDDLRFNGRGRLIAISGEAGVGKSRLVAELLRYLRALPHDDGGLPVVVLENQVSPYDASRPYAGLQARFRKVFGIKPDDPPEVVREKFVERGKQFPPDFRERAARVIQRVMALDIETSASDDFERDEFKAELANVVLQIVRGWNPEGAFMLVGEDYHWGDAASMEILSHLYSLLDEQPVLFLSTFRPDVTAPVMNILNTVRAHYGQHLLEIQLDPLPPSDTHELVQTLIEGESVAAESLRAVIKERSEGNPLFVEEILIDLADRGAIEPAGEERDCWRPVNADDLTGLSIPTSLQALLLERIDRLPRDARRTLQQAAVLGRSFSRRVLSEISEIDGALGEHLEALTQAGLVRRLDDGSDESLKFRHALIQDAAYETILRRHRREFHRRAAESMDRLYADRHSEFAGAIGCHYYQADDPRAIAWLVMAAEQARSVYEPATVIDRAGKAIDLSASLGLEAPVEALHLRGHAYDMLGDYVAARTDLQSVLDIARSRADQSQEWEALIDLGSLWAESDYSRAGPLFERAYDLARALQDDAKIGYSLNRLGNWKINTGIPKSALDAHQQALHIFEQLSDLAGLAETLDLLGLASYLTADFVASASSFRQAIEIFREAGDNRGLASSLSLLALSGGGFDTETSPAADGDPDEWIGIAHEALDLARLIGWRAGEAFALLTAGTIIAAHGDPGAGLDALRQGRELASKIGHHQWLVGATDHLGVVGMSLLQWDEARDYLAEALALARGLGSAYWTRSATSHLADLLIDVGELERAEKLLTDALEVDATLDSLGQRKLWFRVARLALARDDSTTALEVVDWLLATAPGKQPGDAVPALSMLRGQALAGQGLFEAATVELQAAASQASAERNRALVWRIQATLAGVYLANGDERQAGRAVDDARATVNVIAGQIPDEAVRDVFLARAGELISRGSSPVAG